MAKHDRDAQRIAHGYFDLDLGVVWQTKRTDLPTLLLRLEEIYRDAGEEMT